MNSYAIGIFFTVFMVVAQWSFYSRSRKKIEEYVKGKIPEAYYIVGAGGWQGWYVRLALYDDFLVYSSLKLWKLAYSEIEAVSIQFHPTFNEVYLYYRDDQGDTSLMIPFYRAKRAKELVAVIKEKKPEIGEKRVTH